MYTHKKTVGRGIKSSCVRVSYLYVDSLGRLATISWEISVAIYERGEFLNLYWFDGPAQRIKITCVFLLFTSTAVPRSMSDPRFARFKSDPRFRKPKRSSQKVVVDDRFKSVFETQGKKKKKSGPHVPLLLYFRTARLLANS